jgi:enamine deaminase RidA (YjgF/YER057c/UK114 family)
MNEYVEPKGWLPPKGYSNGVSARGRIICVAGQVGWDPRNQTFGMKDFAHQASQALDNVLVVLRAAGAAPGHVVRMTWYVTDRQAYLDSQQEVGIAYRTRFGSHYPAMTLIIVKELLEKDALVEIEATAIVPDEG